MQVVLLSAINVKEELKFAKKGRQQSFLLKCKLLVLMISTALPVSMPEVQHVESQNVDKY
jgi:hypothetical protein